MLIGKQIRTKCAVYAGKQKYQRLNLERLPAGTIGVVKDQEVTFSNVEVCMVRFMVGKRRYFALLGPSSFEIL